MKIVLTGTRAYGPAREDSDYDIVMCYWDADRIKRFLNESDVHYEKNSRINPVYEGFTFKLGNSEIQIICADNKVDLDAWEYATEIMIHCKPVSDRDKRIVTFRKYYKQYKQKKSLRY